MPLRPSASATVADPLRDFAPAKVNLTLHVRGRRADGWHALESLVAFADVGDDLVLMPDTTLALEVAGPTAAQSGPADDNLILKAARALAEQVPGLRAGRFILTKRLPVAAGIGGGSSDAAAALRLLARLNALSLDDPRLMAVARAIGADVPVCLDPQARMMSGVGEALSVPVKLPGLPAVLVNPGVGVATPEVFRSLGLKAGESLRSDAHPPCSDVTDWSALLAAYHNDLTAAACRVAPVIGDVLAAMETTGCRLVRMSGSGATCFGLYGTATAATTAAAALSTAHPRWWVRAVTLS